MDLREEVKQVASHYRTLGMKLLVSDTEGKFLGIGTGKELSDAASSKNVQLAKASDH